MNARYSIVIAGGGPAGSATALTLTRAGHHVVLIEESGHEDFRVGEALPPAVCPLLRELGVWESFLADGHRPSYGNVAAWGSGEAQVTDFIFSAHGYGWHIDRGRFDARLREAALLGGGDVQSGARVVGVEHSADGTLLVRVRQADRMEGILRCDWLVDATGRRSAVARLCGAERRHEDHLLAFYGRFDPVSRPGEDRETRTIIESEPDGWWYTALVPSGQRIVAFLTDPDLVDRATLLSGDGLLARLEQTRLIQPLLVAHRYLLSGAPRAVDASSARLDCFAGAGWVAVGDAAMSLDPLSSQGILNALHTGTRAGQALVHTLSGEPTALTKYVRGLEEIYAAYLVNRADNYSAETRWCERPFWRPRSVVRQEQAGDSAPRAARVPAQRAGQEGGQAGFFRGS